MRTDQERAMESLMEHMENAAKTFERAAEEMRQHAKRAQQAFDENKVRSADRWTVTPLDVAGWAISHAVSFPGSNIRVDLIAKYAAEASR